MGSDSIYTEDPKWSLTPFSNLTTSRTFAIDFPAV